MSYPDDERLVGLLKSTFPPLGNQEPLRDLWPDVLRRLDQDAVHVPWLDWALVGLLAALLLVYPEMIPVLFCCL